MPRLLSEKHAAKALGIPLATFRDLVATGKLPKPLDQFGLYDMKAIDAAFDRISGLGSPRNAYDAWKEKRHAAR